MRVFAIDPGPTESAFAFLIDGAIQRFGKVPNVDIGRRFCEGLRIQAVVCERIRSFGMPAGAELFETAEWCGYFRRQAAEQSIAWHWLTRIEVKNHLCHSSRANDSNIRQSIIDRFGGKEKAIGRKACPGPLYGISGDVWAALAVALTWWDQSEFARRIA